MIAKFVAAIPSVLLQVPPGPSPELLAKMPEILRENFARRQLNADFEGTDFSIQFYASDTPVIDSVRAEVRGEGNPIPALSVLCLPNGWAVINDGDDSSVDLTQPGSPAWDQFCTWRDKAIETMKHARG